MLQFLDLQGPHSVALEQDVTLDRSEAHVLCSVLPVPAAGKSLLKAIQQDFSGNTWG